MQPAIRDQNETHQERERGAETSVIDCSGDRDPARQEAKDDTDINIILDKFGVGAFTDRKPTWTETDFNMDLQQAMASVDQLQQAHSNLPPELRDKYPTWQHMINAAESGELKKDFNELKTAAQQRERQERYEDAIALDDHKVNTARARKAKAAAEKELSSQEDITTDKKN